MWRNHFFNWCDLIGADCSPPANENHEEALLMKALGIIGLLLALLYVAFLSTEDSKEAVTQKEKAAQQVEQVQKQIDDAMKKNMEKLEQETQ